MFTDADNRLIMIFVAIVIISPIAYHYIEKKDGPNFYRNVKILLITTGTVIGLVFAYFRGESPKLFWLYTILGVLAGCTSWLSYFCTEKRTLRYQERINGNNKEPSV